VGKNQSYKVTLVYLPPLLDGGLGFVANYNLCDGITPSFGIAVYSYLFGFNRLSK
jgi:hypothetical protein